MEKNSPSLITIIFFVAFITIGAYFRSSIYRNTHDLSKFEQKSKLSILKNNYTDPMTFKDATCYTSLDSIWNHLNLVSTKQSEKLNSISQDYIDDLNTIFYIALYGGDEIKKLTKIDKLTIYKTRQQLLELYTIDELNKIAENEIFIKLLTRNLENLKFTSIKWIKFETDTTGFVSYLADSEDKTARFIKIQNNWKFNILYQDPEMKTLENRLLEDQIRLIGSEMKFFKEMFQNDSNIFKALIKS